MNGINLKEYYIHYMSILKVAKLGHPILLKKAIEIKDFSSDSLKNIIYNMSETMIDYNGIGLAAPQVHLSKRIVIFRNPDQEESEKINISPLINPIFSPLSEETEDDWEGCLSIPDIREEIKRPSSVRIKFTDISGVLKEDFFEGLWATCIQHEIDHLNGRLFIDYLGPIKRSFITKKMKKYKKEINKK